MNHATYTSCSIIYMSRIITFISTQNRSSRNKQTYQHSTVSPSTSLRLRGLAQTRRVRSGELPLCLGEGSRKGAEALAGSRLGETPLAWARCSLAQKRSWSPGRPFAQKSWASSLFISPRRDWLAWTRLISLATVFLEQSHPPVHNNTSSHCTHSEHQTN